MDSVFYTHYKNNDNLPSVLRDYISFRCQKYQNDLIRVLLFLGLDPHSESSPEKEQNAISIFEIELSELMKESWPYLCEKINDSALDKLCKYINSGVGEEYREGNSENIKKLFYLLSDNKYELFKKNKFSTMHISIPIFKDVIDINIVLPIEGMVTGIYLFERYHPAFREYETKYYDPEKNEKDPKSLAKTRSPSNTSSMRNKFKVNDIVCLNLPENKRLFANSIEHVDVGLEELEGEILKKKDSASEALEYIQNLYDYVNKVSLIDDECSLSKINIEKEISKSALRWSSHEEVINNDIYKRYMLFFSEIIKKIDLYSIFFYRYGLYLEMRHSVWNQISNLGHNIRSFFYLLINCGIKDEVIRNIMSQACDEFVPLSLNKRHIEYNDYRFLENNGKDLRDSCAKIYRFIAVQYTFKLLQIYIEQSKNVIDIPIKKVTEKQSRLFLEKVRQSKSIFDINDLWLNDYLGINPEGRKKLDKYFIKYEKKLKNPELVGNECELDIIQKILIYQICASNLSIKFNASSEFSEKRKKNNRRSSNYSLEKILAKKLQDIRISIWLDLLIQKQFYVNLGYEDIWKKIVKCQQLAAKDYSDIVYEGYYGHRLCNQYEENYKDIEDNFLKQSEIVRKYYSLNEIVRVLFGAN